MHPYLFHLGPLALSTYGALLAVGFLAAVWLTTRTSRRLEGHVAMSPSMVMDWACWAIVGGILGGRVLYVAMNWPVYAAQPLEIIALWHGGLIWYGGFAGGLLGSRLFWRRHGMAFLHGTDQVIPFVALAHAIGRIGCFFNGCCSGIPTTAWFGVQFPGWPQPVVPTQLFEAIGLVVLYAALRMLQRPAWLARPGTVFGAYLVGYAVLRWILETWRDQQPIVWSGLTLAQVISAALLLVGLALLVRLPRSTTRRTA